MRMKRHLAIPVLIGLLVVVGATASQAVVVQKDDLRVNFDASFSPQALPRSRPAPVTIQVHGAISTTDGSHPPPLRMLEVELNRNGRISTEGLQACSSASLQSTSTSQALARCGAALVGHGHFQAQVNLSGEVSAGGEILAFNSRRHDKPALLLHFFVEVPVRLTLVVPLTIGHKADGQFGTILRSRIPRLGGGLGSITEIDLSIARRYSFAGKRRSYVSAACSAPAGLPGGVFPFARARFRFESHRLISPEPLRRSCHVLGGV
ncbi:MAG: hypothetical protein ACTHKT_14055 [Solirubrobacterales bacterium]